MVAATSQSRLARSLVILGDRARSSNRAQEIHRPPLHLATAARPGVTDVDMHMRMCAYYAHGEDEASPGAHGT